MRLMLLTAAVLVSVAGGSAGQAPAQPDPLDLFVVTLEQAAAAGDREAILNLGHPDGERAGLQDFVYTMSPAPSRVVIKERDRSPIDGGMHRLMLEVFIERGIEARISTWRVDLRARDDAPSEGTAAASAPTWQVARMERLTVVSGLYRLSLDETRQFDVRDLTINAPDLTLRMPSGTAFVAEVPEGTTAVVLMGRGHMKFAPPDEAEQTQLRIFSGGGALDAEFDAAFIRVRPSEFASRFRASSLVPREVSPGDPRRAAEVFDEFVGRTLHIDLGDLSRDRWSIVPSASDLIAEVRTRRHGNLTYARTWNESEDISVFDRRRRRNIAVYASAEKLAARGRFYSEDDLVDYDVLSYEIDTAFDPDRQFVTGRTHVRLKVRAPLLTTITLRLAEPLAVRSVTAPGIGRLLHLRVVGQNSLIVNLPGAVPRDTEIPLTIVYSGRVEPQELDREAIAVAQEQGTLQVPLEPRFIYSNRSYWYPQASVTDYATVRLRITVPPGFDVVATGTPSGSAAPVPGPVPQGGRPRRVFLFETDRPVRYVGCIISRFSTVTSAELNIPPADLHGVRVDSSADDGAGPAGGGGGSVSLVVQANPRQAGRARSLSQKSAEIMQFYAALLGQAPYPSLTLAVTESDLPGGHSPPYFVILNQPLPTTQLSWRNDPVAFENYPAFFLAHELAHQWWGQAVGWKNYHEQWLSEGFAQYFAILFAEHERGAGLVSSLLRQMRRTAVGASDQGPVYLGYRLGHIRSDSRIFRALVYNKGAMALHMLRRLVGDEAFFSGLRDFYGAWQYRKAGTDDFRIVMENASRRDLTAFFEGWIYSSSIPRIRFTYKAAAESVLLRFEHRGDVLPVPVTVTLTYDSGRTQDVVVPVTERVVERTITLTERLRKAEANEESVLALFDK
jgi:hypothetical protein